MGTEEAIHVRFGMFVVIMIFLAPAILTICLIIGAVLWGDRRHHRYHRIRQVPFAALSEREGLRYTVLMQQTSNPWVSELSAEDMQVIEGWISRYNPQGLPVGSDGNLIGPRPE